MPDCNVPVSFVDVVRALVLPRVLVSVLVAFLSYLILRV